MSSVAIVGGVKITAADIEILQRIHPKFAKHQERLVQLIRRQHMRPELDETAIAAIQTAERKREIRKAKRRATS